MHRTSTFGLVVALMTGGILACSGGSSDVPASEDALRQSGLLDLNGVFFAVEGVAPCDASACRTYKLRLANAENIARDAMGRPFGVHCPDGSFAEECVVSAIDLTGLALAPQTLAEVRALLVDPTKNSLEHPRLLLNVANQTKPNQADEPLGDSVLPKGVYVSTAAFDMIPSWETNFYFWRGKCEPPAGPRGVEFSLLNGHPNTHLNRPGPQLVGPPELWTVTDANRFCSQPAVVYGKITDYLFSPREPLRVSLRAAFFPAR